MKIYKTCEHCKKDYTVPPARAEKTRFCSMACRNASDRTATRRELTCETCSTKFTSVADHGVWPRFCCRTCFLNQCVRPLEKPCATCGAMFDAGRANHKSEDGLRKYCSKTCRNEGLKRGNEHQCLNCGETFYLSPSTLMKRSQAGCCSAECQKSYYTGALSHAFKGGSYIHSQAGEKHLLLPRQGYVGKYIGEHRVVASREIGRMVLRGEFVIRVNRDPEDNRPQNLFICESGSEYARRRSGSLPWPTESNLQHYKARALRASPNPA